MLNRLADRLDGIEEVRTRTVHLQEPFSDMGARFAGEPGSVVLLSGGDLDCARHHILAIRPWMTIAGWRDRTIVTLDGEELTFSHPPLDVLETVLDRCHLPVAQEQGPICAGLFGYLAYDLKDTLEVLPRTTIDPLNLPHLFLVAPSLIVVRDKTSGTTVVHAPVRRGHPMEAAEAAIDGFLQRLKDPLPVSGGFSVMGAAPKSNFTRDAYLASVQRIREYIAAGDVYQVNLSQRFETGFHGDGYDLFRTLYRMNPAPFFAFVHAGDHQIVSTSPERFLCQRGRRVETRPIKGTRPRGKTEQEDRAMRADLIQSPKDAAELSMIVDLLRNDIGKVCAGGSVAVSAHKRLEAYQNVHHLVSDVTGTLAKGRSTVDLIRATFPGGSITGCPKIRSMEIIDELETHCRHIYTGSIGYIGFDDTMDLSIAIRTATIAGDRLVFSVGGGIVFDSDPEDEYDETLHKGQTLMKALTAKGSDLSEDGAEKPWVWQDGRLIPLEAASVSAADLGLQYGFGFFETIRVEKGSICRLDAHILRFDRAWKNLFPGPPPDVTWKEIIGQVIEKNRLTDTVAAVKILATRGDGNGGRTNGTLVVLARSYRHRLAVLGSTGLRLATYPKPRQTPLADHKTLNYLYYHLAGLWARAQGADEAVILNPDGTLSETNTASILVVSERGVRVPHSPHVLDGTMQQAVVRRLEAMGYTIETKPMLPADISDTDMVLLTNSLMGAVPALSLDERQLTFDASLLDSINEETRQRDKPACDT